MRHSGLGLLFGLVVSTLACGAADVAGTASTGQGSTSIECRQSSDCGDVDPLARHCAPCADGTVQCLRWQCDANQCITAVCQDNGGEEQPFQMQTCGQPSDCTVPLPAGYCWTCLDNYCGLALPDGTLGITCGNPPAADGGAPTQPPVLVQQAGSVSSSSVPTSTYSASFAGPVTPGDLIVVAFWWNFLPGAGSVMVADSAGGSYAQVVTAVQSENNAAWIYYATVPAGSASGNTVTVTTGASTADLFAMTILEYQGPSTLDAASAWASGAVPASQLLQFSAGPLTTAGPDELFVAVGLADLTPVNAGTGFQSRFFSDYFCVEDSIATTPTTSSAAFTANTSSAAGGTPYAAAAAVAAFR